MNAKKLQYFKKLLLEKRNEVHERIEHLREVAMESPAATGNNSSYSERESGFAEMACLSGS